MTVRAVTSEGLSGEGRPDTTGRRSASGPVSTEAIGRHRRAIGVASAPVRRLLWRSDVEGFENLPTEGPVILAANHRSFCDSPLLMFGLGRPVTMIGKAEYLDHVWSRRLFPAAGMIPVDRADPASGRRALEAATAALERGEALGVFPEGTRSRDGRLHGGHTGVAHLAMTTSAPLLPVGLVGTATVQPPGSILPRPWRRAVIRLGAPIDTGAVVAAAGDRRRRRRALIEALMAEIAALCGQPRADGPCPTGSARSA